MGSLFIEGEGDQALAERGARKTVINKKSLAIFSLIFSRLDMLSRTSHQQKIELGEVFAKEIYRTLIVNNKALTKDIFKAITMTY